MAADQNQKIE